MIQVTFKHKNLTAAGSASLFLLNFTNHVQAEINNDGEAILTAKRNFNCYGRT